MVQSPAPDVDAYLAALSGPRVPALVRLRELCRAELVGAAGSRHTEVMAYGMPAYTRDGTAEIAFAHQK